jgi:hypothetical protein
LVIMMTPARPVLWTACHDCGNPAVVFDHDELAYLMAIHNGVVHLACPDESTLERILTHATPHADPVRNHALIGRPRQLVFYSATTARGQRPPRA